MDNHPVPPTKRQLAAQTLFVSQLMDTLEEEARRSRRAGAARPNLSHNVLRCSHGMLSDDQGFGAGLLRNILAAELCNSCWVHFLTLHLEYDPLFIQRQKSHVASIVQL